VSWPGHVREGQTSNALAELTDLAPTLLDAAGLDHHAGMQGDSLWPILTGRADPDEHREDVYCEYYHALERPRFYDAMQEHGIDSEFHRWFERSDVKPEFHDEFFENESRLLPYATMVRTDRYKLVHVHSLDTGELYDLHEDPDESNNLYDDTGYQSVKLDMFERLSNRMAQTIDPLPQRIGRW
jgi:arylsulfatase A-like enzyme